LRLVRGVWHGMTVTDTAVRVQLTTGETVRIEVEAADVEDAFEAFRLNASVEADAEAPTDAAGEFGLGRNDVVLFTGATWSVTDTEALGVELREGAAMHFSGHPGQLADDADVVCLTTDAIVIATTTGTGMLVRVGLKPGTLEVVHDQEVIAAFLLERGYTP
jgi:hypothetical protein